MIHLVAGAGGFIGGHLVKRLLDEGKQVRAADVKPREEWWQLHDEADNVERDLRLREECRSAPTGVGEVYNLAADMGGMGFIENNKAACMLSVMINTHLLDEARKAQVEKFFYASSACVYAANHQVAGKGDDGYKLSEDMAYPAMPEDGYGWEKLFSERMCRHFSEDFGLATRVARFHNVYGPHGSWTGGREKAPAAICRKVIEAKHKGPAEIEIWGDGTQVRSFMYVDDCVEGVRRLMDSEHTDPINIGSEEFVTINQLVDCAESAAELSIPLDRRYKLDAPKGVAGRCSDNAVIRNQLGWEPSISLKAGLATTYEWIEGEYRKRSR